MTEYSAPEKSAPDENVLNDRAVRQLKKSSPLIFDLMAFIRRYVVLSRAQLAVVSLWIVHTYALDQAEQTPYLSVTSAVKQSGKSRLLEVLELLVRDPAMWTLPSDAVIYRTIHASRPTVLLDEIDTVFNPKTADRYEGLRNLLNSGHRRGSKVPRCLGASNKIVEFNVFSAKVIAGIGTLPDTVADRSIPIRLKRKARTETVQRLRQRGAQAEGEQLRERIQEWIDDQAESLAGAEPDMPDELSDRMQDGCEPLVAIADEMGCGDVARRALVALLTAERVDSQENISLRLLGDIRQVFDSSGDRIRTANMLLKLSDMPESPWASWYGRGLTDRDLAAMLQPYEIRSITVRPKGGGTPGKGYKREDFYDAWQRYLPS